MIRRVTVLLVLVVSVMFGIYMSRQAVEPHARLRFENQKTEFIHIKPLIGESRPDTSRQRHLAISDLSDPNIDYPSEESPQDILTLAPKTSDHRARSFDSNEPTASTTFRDLMSDLEGDLAATPSLGNPTPGSENGIALDLAPAELPSGVDGSSHNF